jgi:ATP-binding protein involved in chromosome partitioning
MEARISIIKNRLQKISRIISVVSGKGGVGKSLVATSLSLNLIKKGYKVGLLDLDLYAPSSHIILGVKDIFPKEEKGIIPPDVDGVKFMSIVYFTDDKPSAFRGIDISNIIIELLAITQWKELDYLIIDMPPGIGDETLDVIRLIKKSEFLVVTTPSKVAMGTVNKILKILNELDKHIIGIVENMVIEKTMFIKDEINKIGLKYLGLINYDFNLEKSIGNSKKLIRSNFMKDLDKIVGKIKL